LLILIILIQRSFFKERISCSKPQYEHEGIINFGEKKAFTIDPLAGLSNNCYPSWTERRLAFEIS